MIKEMTDTMETENAWYTQLREQWKPEHVRLLLIGESAPDDKGDPAARRFFYNDRLTGKDALFRAVVHAELDTPYLDGKTETKERWLEQLRDRGIFLIDLVPYPINAASGTSRAAARRANVADCVARTRALQPDGIIVCHGPSHRLLKPALAEAGLPLLHDEQIPFPLGNWRATFVERYRQAVERLDSTSYEAASDEWDSAGEQTAWDATTADGLDRTTR
ncbi:hypothetical protein GCM10011512_09650 [Tersicoccus solisilvae]|uniref:Uracil-DNA glycosylase-like domain-containing protein n=1 Tax=Tersicoccus solisilvae TaxID=1882339 RepID=A0ABQ1P1B2_9MICC|nr:hypothetical protein [Tersicoccus solisilvae]GGC84867.1 hypothetical protein GCM10011512_09650 [Tersicoccus solisilvae]